MKKKIVAGICSTFLMMGCSQDSGTYRKITPEEAKALMEQDEVTIVDVRTSEEFAQGYIEGALLLPDNEIVTKAEELLPHKDAVILLYCRSGRRSELAARALMELGYTQVLDFGGILDWPYETVKP